MLNKLFHHILYRGAGNLIKQFLCFFFIHFLYCTLRSYVMIWSCFYVNCIMRFHCTKITWSQFYHTHGYNVKCHNIYVWFRWDYICLLVVVQKSQSSTQLIQWAMCKFIKHYLLLNYWIFIIAIQHFGFIHHPN